MTNVPQIQWTPAGLVVPSEADILAGVLADFNAAFGGNLNLALSTPQGQLATSLAAVIANSYAQFVNMVNGMNPDLNSGFMQDAIGRIYFLNRNPGTPTVVNCICVGLAGTVIPAGALAQDTSGNLYQCTLGGTIPISGSFVLEFTNVVDGPIACPPNTLTLIYQAIAGWDSINNAVAGTPGTTVESAQAFEYRREQTIAANAQGSGPAIYGAVFDVPGVTDVYYTENDTTGIITVGSTGVSLLPNSIYVGVIGGTTQAVAEAIFTKKSPGCNMSGNISYVVSDPSGYLPPVPTYVITFNDNTQNPVNVFFAISIKNATTLPSNIVSLIQQAVVAQFTGASGSPRARIGSIIAAANYAAAVQNAAGPGVIIPVLSIALGTQFGATAQLTNGSKIITMVTVGTGQVTFGTVLTGVDIPTGSYIVEQLTGTPGGPGTYLMSQTATGTVSSPEVVSGAPGPSGQFGIDQQPTIAVGNVAVTLV